MTDCEYLKKKNGKWVCTNRQPIECTFSEMMECKATTMTEVKR